jgi:hypothetical protein
MSTALPLVSAERLSAPTWECTLNDDIAQGVAGARCALRVEGEFFYMEAGSYTVPQDQIMSATQLIKEIFPGIYNKKFQNVKMSPPEATQHLGASGQLWFLSATHERIGKIEKLQKVFTKKDRVYLMSCEGRKDSVAKHMETCTNWLASVEFPLLRGLKTSDLPE